MAAVKDYYVSPCAAIEGPVVLGTGCIVLAGARITAANLNVPLHLGTYCLVEEYAEIVLTANGPSAAVSVGDHNHFKARCHVEDVGQIGSGNVFHSFACVRGVARIGNFTVFSSAVRVESNEPPLVIPSNTILMASPAHGTSTAYSWSLPCTEGSRTYVAVPRHGSRSVAELPLLARFLASINGAHSGGGKGGGVAAACTSDADSAASGDPEDESGDGDDDGGREHRSLATSTPTSSGADEPQARRARPTAADSKGGVVAVSEDASAVTPPKQRLAAQASSAERDRRRHGGRRRDVGDAAHNDAAFGIDTGPFPDDVNAMLAQLPAQAEAAVVLDVVKKCRYYLTLYNIL